MKILTLMHADQLASRVKQHRSAAMAEALLLARRALAAGEVPIGAVVLDARGKVIGAGSQGGSAHAHAELAALTDACVAQNVRRLDGCTLVSTLEPCAMCAAACDLHHLAGIVTALASPKYGAWSCGVRSKGRNADSSSGDRGRGSSAARGGGVYGSPCTLELLGVPEHAEASAALLRAFFAVRRGSGGSGGARAAVHSCIVSGGNVDAACSQAGAAPPLPPLR